ncbi:MAG: YkgJ family cysteine cluster protein [Phycisphaerae bacterium]
MATSTQNSGSPWYAAGLQFSCTQCGNCCSGPPGYVWLSPSDIAPLAALVGLSPDEFRARHVRQVGDRVSLYEKSDGDCEWLIRGPDGKTRCGVYEARPVQCRTWPFWDSNLRTPRDWKGAARVCPGINTGTRHPLPVIHAALRRNADAQLAL